MEAVKWLNGGSERVNVKVTANLCNGQQPHAGGEAVTLRKGLAVHQTEKGHVGQYVLHVEHACAC